MNFEDFIALLTTTSASLKVALVSAVLGLLALAYSLGYSHAEQPKEEVCALEFKLIQQFKSELKHSERENADRLQAAQLSCVQREQDVCSDRMEKFSENLEKIRCKICKRKGL